MCLAVPLSAEGLWTSFVRPALRKVFLFGHLDVALGLGVTRPHKAQFSQVRPVPLSERGRDQILRNT